MQINNIQPNINNQNNKVVSNKGLGGAGGAGLLNGLDGRDIIRTLGNPDSLMSTITLESSVTGGRGVNAYKRGGQDEFRERFIDDVVSAVFWMKGVDMFNSIGDKFGKKFLKLPTTEFDVGKDALRTPFKNLEADQIAELGGEEKARPIIRKLAIFKFTKIISATLLSTSVIGYIMPKINQKITERIMQQKKMDKRLGLPVENTDRYGSLMQNYSFEEFDKRINGNKIQSFKGSIIGNMTQVSHALENNTICKMLTNDAGIISGRAISARNQDEGVEYVFRDTSSLFFYFASTPLIYSGLQKLTNSKGLTEIDPVAARTIHINLLEQLKNEKGEFVSMNADDFKKKTMGVLEGENKKIVEALPDVITLEELKKRVTDNAVLKRAEAMSQLQPQQLGRISVLTRQQAADAFRNGSITQFNFMRDLYKDRFGNKIFDKYRYISMDKITKFRDNIDKYAQSVIDISKKENNGIVDVNLLEKINKKSYKMSAGFRIFAMSVSALALGFAIPKLQYALTEHRTGSKSAPMFRAYEENK